MLTPKQIAVYDFIKEYIDDNGYAPTGAEIAKAIKISSRGVAHRYVSALVDAGKIRITPGRRRNIELIEDDMPQYGSMQSVLPILGKIAAGHPLETCESDSYLNLTEEFIGPNRFILQVKGDSMLGDNICDGDYIVCENSNAVKKNDIVVALVDNSEATLKRYQMNDNNTVTLLPSNPTFSPMVYEQSRVIVQGIYLGLLRIT